MVEPGAIELVQLLAAILGHEHAAVVHCQTKLSLPRAELNPAPLIDGTDLIALGIAPGREIAVLLKKVRDAQLDGRVADKSAALEYVTTLRDPA